MTTTLRPSGPTEPTPRGGRTRAFAICDNGRPVGELLLSADSAGRGATGRIERLAVDAADRRRGRATVAALAAEEILRDWGCARVEARLPASAAPGLALAAALGYAERSRTLATTLRPSATGDAGAPPDGSFGALTAAEIRAWLTREPPGLASERAVLRVRRHAGQQVGVVWLALPPAPVPAGLDGYVHAVVVRGEHRRRGHGRALLREAERLCLAEGRPGRRLTLGVAVTAGDATTPALCAALGYRPREVHLAKPLG